MNIELVRYYIIDIMLPAVGSTIVILFFTILISGFFGTLLALVLYATAPSGIYAHPKFYMILGAVINAIRAVPTVLQIVLLIPVSRIVVGTALGIKAGIFAVSVGSIPFVSRVMEGKFREVDPNLIEAAKAMGASNMQILFRFVIHETIPSLVTGYSFCGILILGAIAVAGTVGAGGIGIVALNYGYSSFNPYVMYGSISILLVMVVIIQMLGRYLYRKLK